MNVVKALLAAVFALHPNTSGHRRIADLIEAKLNALPATFRR